MSFTTAQALNDARANAKITLALALAGAVAGTGVAPAIHYKTLPEAAQVVLSANYIAQHNLSRLPPAIVPNAWLLTRAHAQRNAPELAAQLDEFPAAMATGAGIGALGLPLTIAGLLALIRRRRKPDPYAQKRSALADVQRRR